jgi:hypothetical protein
MVQRAGWKEPFWRKQIPPVSLRSRAGMTGGPNRKSTSPPLPTSLRAASCRKERGKSGARRNNCDRRISPVPRDPKKCIGPSPRKGRGAQDDSALIAPDWKQIPPVSLRSRVGMTGSGGGLMRGAIEGRNPHPFDSAQGRILPQRTRQEWGRRNNCDHRISPVPRDPKKCIGPSPRKGRGAQDDSALAAPDWKQIPPVSLRSRVGMTGGPNRKSTSPPLPTWLRAASCRKERGKSGAGAITVIAGFPPFHATPKSA